MATLDEAPQRRSPGAAGHGEVLGLFRDHDSLTRADVTRLTGLSRSSVNQRLDSLVSAGFLHTVGEVTPVRGRPAEHFALIDDAGVLLLADLGANSVRAAACNLAGHFHSEDRRPIDIAAGPETVLAEVLDVFEDLLANTPYTRTEVRGVGLDVPGPVDSTLGRVVRPPIMTGWDGFDIPGWFAPRYPSCPVLVDNDVNAMAWGEHQAVFPEARDLLMLKVGTGIGSGIITNGQIYRGADGAAGDIGHLQMPPPPGEDTPQCRCGNSGCVEAYAGGWALVRDLRDHGHLIDSTAQAVKLVEARDPDAIRFSRRAGRILGAALANAVSLLNPSVITIAGQLAQAEDQMLAGMREMIYRGSLPLATRRLRIVPSQLDERAGLVGLAHLLADRIFAPAVIDKSIAQLDR